MVQQAQICEAAEKTSTLAKRPYIFTECTKEIR